MSLRCCMSYGPGGHRRDEVRKCPVKIHEVHWTNGAMQVSGLVDDVRVLSRNHKIYSTQLRNMPHARGSFRSIRRDEERLPNNSFADHLSQLNQLKFGPRFMAFAIV